MSHQREQRWIVNVANTCNLNCRHCYNNGGQDLGDLKVTDIKQEILKGKNQGLTVIDFFGGEPTMAPYFFELVQFLKDHDLKLRLSTNGLKFLQAEFVEQIMATGVLESVQLAFFSRNNQVASYIVNLPNQYLQFLRIVTVLKMQKVQIDIIYILNALNKDTILEDTRWLYETLGVRRWFYSFLEMAGRAQEHPELFCKYSEYKLQLIKAFDYLKTRPASRHDKVEFVWGKGPFCVVSDFKDNYYGVDKTTAASFTYAKTCSQCPAKEWCDGITNHYIERFGDEEFVYTGSNKKLFPLFLKGVETRYVAKHCINNYEIDATGMQILITNDKHYDRDLHHAKQAYFPYLKNTDTDELIDVFKENNRINWPQLDLNKEITAEQFKISLAQQLGLGIDNLSLMHGARESLYLLFWMLLKQNRHCMIPDPAWPGYSFVIKQLGGNIHLMPVNDQGDFNLEQIENFIKLYQPSFILLANPSFPMGKYYDNEALLALWQLCKVNNVYLLVDEIYYDMALGHQPKRFYEDLSLNNLAVIYSFTKVCAAPYNKLGYVLSNQVMINTLQQLKEYFKLNLYSPNLNIIYQLFFEHPTWRQQILDNIKINFSGIDSPLAPGAGYCLMNPQEIANSKPIGNLAITQKFETYFVLYG